MMESAIDEQREGGGVSAQVNDTEAEPNQENTHNNLKGSSNGVMEGEEDEEELNGDGGGGGGGGGDLSSINAMMSAVMSAAGTINGGGAGVDSVHSTTPSSDPSPR